MIERILQIAGFIIIIAGFVVGFTTFNSNIESDIVVVILFAWIGSGLVSGLILLGLGEIIHQLKKR